MRHLIKVLLCLTAVAVAVAVCWRWPLQALYGLGTLASLLLVVSLWKWTAL